MHVHFNVVHALLTLLIYTYTARTYYFDVSVRIVASYVVEFCKRLAAFSGLLGPKDTVVINMQRMALPVVLTAEGTT